MKTRLSNMIGVVVLSTISIILYSCPVSLGVNEVTVSYRANGATAGVAPTSVSVEPGTTVTVAAKPVGLGRTGYQFGGWNSSPFGSGEHYAEGETLVVTSDITLFAEWGASFGALPDDLIVGTWSTVKVNEETGSLLRMEYIFGSDGTYSLTQYPSHFDDSVPPVEVADATSVASGTYTLVDSVLSLVQDGSTIKVPCFYDADSGRAIISTDEFVYGFKATTPGQALTGSPWIVDIYGISGSAAGTPYERAAVLLNADGTGTLADESSATPFADGYVPSATQSITWTIANGVISLVFGGSSEHVWMERFDDVLVYTFVPDPAQIIFTRQ